MNSAARTKEEESPQHEAAGEKLTRSASGRRSIAVRELRVQPVEHPECYRHGQRLVLLLDQQAYSMTPDAAADLMLQLADHVEAMCQS
ncbi:MAG: hypothetical protein ACPHN2_08800 [Sinimarinibacterium flocculans]|uniref:hypothetical protein n=1 Tax=Sinimarinibacterium flocculans TaxID=985250 RepID=UPI003C5E1096